MPTGNVDDIIADVSKLALDTASALNTLNDKIDAKVLALQTQINGLSGGSGPTRSITTAPTNPTVASGAVQGTLVATLSCSALTTPTFSIINSTGQFQLSGNQLQCGPLVIDIAGGTSLQVAVEALDADGVTSVTQNLTVTVQPAAGGGTVVDYDFVSNSYQNGALTDFSNTQATSITETWYDNSQTTFGPNTVRRTTKGVSCKGIGVSCIGKYSQDMHSWTTAGDPGFTNPIMVDIGVDSNGFHAITFENTNNAGGVLSNGGLTEALTSGDKLAIKIRAKDPAVGAACGLVLSKRTTGPGTNANSLATIFGMNGGVPNVTVSDTANTVYNGYVLNADGTYDLMFVHTVQANYLAGAWELCLSSGTATAGQKVELHGGQVARGATDQPWTPTTTTSVSSAADALIYSDPHAILAGATGYVLLELQALDHQTIGTTAISSNPPGNFLKIASTKLLEPNGPTVFKAHGGADTAIGLGGYRGIVRIALSWDNGANSGAGAWSACANGGKVVSGTGLTGAAGVVGFMSGITGFLRRFHADTVRPTDATLQTLSQIWNRTFVNPGTALAPGAAHQTFYDDFDVNSLQTIPTPAFPYGSSQALANAYAVTADGVHFWKPRAHFYTQDPNGNAPNQINHELEEYLDPQVATNYPVISFANSCLNGVTQATANLTTGQQANVGNNPDTPGVKYKYVSWLVSTFGTGDLDNSGGGFNQKFGVFNMRAKVPAHKGSWFAFWLYDYMDTSELDIEEYYGFNPTQATTAIHADNFAHNGPVPPCGPHEMGYDLSKDFHDWTGVWVAGTYKKYFDGELIVSTPTVGSFDNNKKFILLNMAVQPHNPAPFDTGDPAPDATSVATMPWTTQVDRVRVLQFGAT